MMLSNFTNKSFNFKLNHILKSCISTKGYQEKGFYFLFFLLSHQNIIFWPNSKPTMHNVQNSLQQIDLKSKPKCLFRPPKNCYIISYLYCFIPTCEVNHYEKYYSIIIAFHHGKNTKPNRTFHSLSTTHCLKML